MTMTTHQTYPVYEVCADRTTGKWLGYPTPMDFYATRKEWKAAGTDTHKETYRGGERRLILIWWVD